MAENDKIPPNPFSFPASDADQRLPSDPGAEDSDDSILDFNAVASVREGASGTIPLTRLPDPQSSPSLISWTEVIRQHRETHVAPEVAPEPVKIDSVSDKDLLKRIVAEEQDRKVSPVPGERDTDRIGKIPLVNAEDDQMADSAVQLSHELADSSVQSRSGSSVRFDVEAPPSDAGGAMPMPWEEEILEAIPVEDDFDEDIPMAEEVLEEEPEVISLDDLEPAGGSVARMIRDQDSEDITEGELPLGSGVVAEHSSILDLLIQESEAGQAHLGSGVVDIAGKPGPGVLSSLSNDSALKGLSSKSKFVVPDVESPGVAPGNSWLREDLIHPPADEPLSGAQIAQAADVIGGWNDAAPAIQAGDHWGNQDPHVIDQSPPIQAGGHWGIEDASEAIDQSPPIQAGGHWGIEQTAQTADQSPPIQSGEHWEIEEAAEAIMAEGEILKDDEAPLAEVLDDGTPDAASPTAWAGSAWLQPEDEPTAKAGSAWKLGDSGISKRTMASFHLPAENPEEAVDLYSSGPFNRGISDSGRLDISDEEIQEATRKQNAVDSSAIDLNSKSGSSSMFDLDSLSAKAIPIEEIVDLSLPEGAADDSSLIRQFDDILAEEALARGPDRDRNAPAFAEAEPILFDLEATEALAPDEPIPPRARGGRRSSEPEPVAKIEDASTDEVESAVPAMEGSGWTDEESNIPAVESSEWTDPDAPTVETREWAQADAPAIEADEWAEAEPAVEEALDEPPPPRAAKPAKPAKPAKEKSEGSRKKRGGMLVGTLFGALLGGGGLFAAYYFGQLPADPQSLFDDSDGGAVVKKQQQASGLPTTAPTPAPGTAAAESPTPALARQLLEVGNLTQAIAIYDKCDQVAPNVLAGRGQAKWLLYLQKCARDGKPPERKSPEVESATDDLKAAVEMSKGNPKAEIDAARAYLWQGLLEESFDDFAAAEKIYSAAEADLKGEAALALIKAANNRLQVIRPAPGVDLGAVQPEHLFLAFTLLLADEPEGVPTATDPTTQEAGFLFWDAALLAAKHDYASAAKKIPAVKAMHARQQIAMAGRGLNPFSDPREQILPLCLDELTRYWTICDQLYKYPQAKMLVEQKKPAEALAALMAKSKDAEEIAKLVADKLMLKPDEKAADAVMALLAAKAKAEDDRKLADEGKKAADDMVAAVTKSLKDAGVDEPKVEDGLKKLVATKTDAEDKVKAIAEAIEKAGIKEPDTAKALAALIGSRDDAETIVKGLRERFEKAKYIEADATREMMLKAVDDAVTRGAADALVKLAQEKKEAEAKAVKLEIDNEKAKKDAEALAKKTLQEAAELKALTEAKFADVRTPSQIMDIWLPALVDAEKLANPIAALADADLVLKNDASDNTAKAKAAGVKALALRNQGKLTEARAAFDEAKKHPGFAKDQAWTKEIAKAAEVLDNPTAFVTGSPSAAPVTPEKLLEQVENGLKLFSPEMFPQDNARLLARRGLLKLEANDLEGAATDAEAAIAGGAGPEGQFTLGRVREQQGRSVEAEQAYRAVVKTSPESTVLVKQARLGLARVLLQRTAKPAVAPAKEPAADRPAKLVQPIRPEMILFMTLLLVADDESDASILEAIKLADILIAEKEYLGYIIKADALAKLKRYNAALQEYSTGIKALKVLPKEYDGVLDRILAQHPALQKPDAAITLDPSLALKHYGMGLEFFRDGHYENAEKEFIQSIRLDNMDARYMYFLGLSRWLQNKNEAAMEDFKAGAALELQGRPIGRTINSSLESIQGTTRMVIEKYRP